MNPPAPDRDFVSSSQWEQVVQPGYKVTLAMCPMAKVPLLIEEALRLLRAVLQNLCHECRPVAEVCPPHIQDVTSRRSERSFVAIV